MITCPKCSHEFEPTEAVSKKIREDIEKEFATKRGELLERYAETKAKVEEEAREQVEKMRRQVAKERAEIGETVARERNKIAAEARDSVSAELVAANELLASQKAKLEVAKSQELMLRRKAQELEDARHDLELEVARKLDSERARITEEAGARAVSEFQFKEATWEKQRQDMARQIDELRRKAEQSVSQQAQGETLELAIETLLKDTFPDDSIEEVAKGVRGGDVTQHVQTRGGVLCGKILWELKRTKTFSQGWVAKLKEDKRSAKADHAVIVTTAMPEGIKTIGQVDGVWVVNIDSFLGIAAVLRSSLLEAERVRASFTGKKEKLSELYDFVNSTDFRNQVTALVESFVGMQQDLESEKRAFAKMWKQREMQITKGIGTIAGVYGGMSGLVSLQPIPQLELK